ncbi:hypothetical protein Lfu02_54780 [Longispora fulva]|uniref:Putative lipoprotein with Yx(FWY)xxD motif n=1 Tax=Longispora fulva TaxID=619741 RepID=A0A8J7GJ32_9ACTN|nr:hypothetical protein [Longispora fulva]MBG6137540.1 putative lipoprotein with Yx(FWY)xxD motif [Longispora fulva]GIG61106.1 hypothetical protein Lfu02_54780 [Longispora fulva]
MKKLIALAVLTGSALAMTACTTTAPKTATPATSAPATSTSAAGAPQTLRVATVEGFTTFVTNAKGRTIYRFDKDTNNPAKSTCFDACAENWPPVLAGPNGAVDIEGVDKSLVGLLDRPEGRQVTLKGWPLYYFKTDVALGQTAGHGRNGVWFAIAPDGTKAKKADEAPVKSNTY